MRVRRSLTGRTDVRLPRGRRRTASATALLLSFALLCTAVSLAAPARRGRAISPLAPIGSSRTAAADRAGVPSPGSVPVRSLPGDAGQPLPSRQRIHLPRSLAAIDQKSAASALLTAALPAVFPAAEPTVASAPFTEEPQDRFLSYASRTSRTRGPPVSG